MIHKYHHHKYHHHKCHHHQYIHHKLITCLVQNFTIRKNPSIITCKIDEYHNNQLIRIITKLLHQLVEVKWGRGKASRKIQREKVSCKTCKINNNRLI